MIALTVKAQDGYEMDMSIGGTIDGAMPAVLDYDFYYYEECTVFYGVDPGAELTLCRISYEDWIAEQNNIRVVQVDLMLNNTGTVGVCNVSVQIENIFNAVTWWPQWMNTTMLPFYLEPGQVVRVGANVPKREGWPLYAVAEIFNQCEYYEMDEEKGNNDDCIEYEVDGGSLSFCLLGDGKIWREPSGERMVQVNGRVSNTGGIPICGITVEIDNEKDAVETWPGWYPTYIKPLKPYKSLNFGASIAMPSGEPSAALIDWYNCDDEEVADDDYFYYGENKGAGKQGKARGVVRYTDDYEYNGEDSYYYETQDSNSMYYDSSASGYYYDSSSYSEPSASDYYGGNRNLRN